MTPTVRSTLVSIGVAMLEFVAGLLVGAVVGMWMMIDKRDQEIYKPMDDDDDWNYR